MSRVNGLHHITAICGNAQQNLDFYVGILGMRLVKKSVNQDDPGTYHLFYADAEGHSGTDLTFFPWPELATPRFGHGLAVETNLAVPLGSIAYWESRLEKYGVQMQAVETRFGNTVLPLVDSHGFKVALVETADPAEHRFTPWNGSTVPQERQIRGLYGAQLWERTATPTTEFLTQVLGFKHLATENGWARYGFDDVMGVVDVRETPNVGRGSWGVGCVHHLAWRVDDEEHQLAMRRRVQVGGGNPTPVIDRFWFKSVYFREPGGVLFEIATDGPGFAIDENQSHLGEELVLAPFLESHRAQIEGMLPVLTLPTAAEPSRRV